MAYTGTSIVDYLKSIGQDSSYSARSALASQYGITNYTGSADQNLALLNKLQSNTGSIPTITQPKTLETSNTTQTSTNDLLTNALTELQKRLTTNITPKSTSDIKDTSTIPEQSLYIKSPALTTTTADSINSMIQKEQEALAAKQASAQKTLSDAGLLGTGNTLQEQLLTGYQANVPVSQYQTKLAEAQNRYGVIEALDEYKLQGEKVAQAKAAIENLDLQRQTELDAALNRQASMNSISAEQQRINQKYDSQRAKLVGDYNIEAAILATKSNNLTEANKLVSQAVDAYTSDITAEINRFNNFYSIASDFVSSLSSEEKSVLDDVKTQLINKEREEKERMFKLGDLLLQYPSAGIDVKNDTFEEALQKAGITAQEYERIEKANMELDRRMKEASLKLTELEIKQAEAIAGQGTFTDKDQEEYDTVIFNYIAQAQAIADKEDKTLFEAINNLPLSMDKKQEVAEVAARISIFEGEEKAEALGRLKDEPITPKLVDELMNSGIKQEEMESALVDNYKKKELQKAITKTQRAENVYQSVLNEIRKYKKFYSTDFKIINETPGYITIESTEPINMVGRPTSPIISLGEPKHERFKIAKGNLITHLGFVFDNIPIIDLMIERNPNLVSQSLIDERRYEKRYEENITSPFSIED